MALKKFNPTTPSQRELVLVDRSALHKGDPVKALTQGLSKKGGRNNHGRITARRRGGGHKRLYRLVDFKRRKYDVAATVVRLEFRGRIRRSIQGIQVGCSTKLRGARKDPIDPRECPVSGQARQLRYGIPGGNLVDRPGDDLLGNRWAILPGDSLRRTTQG